MLHDHTHPSDQTLILSIDHELSEGHQIALDQHLRRCEHCRGRSSALASMADEISRLHRGDGPTPTDALRRRLQGDLAELGTRWDQSIAFRVRTTIATLPWIVRASASVALIAIAVAFVRSGREPVLLTVPLSAESLPIRTLTPGAVGPLGRDALCAGRSPARSPIASAVRQAVLRQYEMEGVPEREYELDYLITPELGGTADPRNLWPERYASDPWNAHVKDDLERLLPQLVCQGTIDLATAQQDIAANWIAAYKKYLRTDHPIGRQANVTDDDDDDDDREIEHSSPDADVTPAASPAFVLRRVSLTVSLEREATFAARGRRSDRRGRP